MAGELADVYYRQSAEETPEMRKSAGNFYLLIYEGGKGTFAMKYATIGCLGEFVFPPMILARASLSPRSCMRTATTKLWVEERVLR